MSLEEGYCLLEFHRHLRRRRMMEDKHLPAYLHRSRPGRDYRSVCSYHMHRRFHLRRCRFGLGYKSWDNCRPRHRTHRCLYPCNIRGPDLDLRRPCSCRDNLGRRRRQIIARVPYSISLFIRLESASKRGLAQRIGIAPIVASICIAVQGST